MLVTSPCHSGSTLPPPPLRSATNRSPTNVSTLPRRRSPTDAPPAARSPSIPEPPAPAVVVPVRHRPDGNGSTETTPGDSDSPQRRPAYAPANRSRDGIQSDACRGHADAAAVPPASGRTTLRPAPHTNAPPRVRRSADWPPSRCCRERGSCCPDPHARTVAGTIPDDAAATDATAAIPLPTASADRRWLAQTADARRLRTARGWRSRGCHATSGPGPTPV